MSSEPRATASVSPAEEWYRSHVEGAAGEVIDFFGGDGISLTGKRVADLGAGDGSIDLGIALKAQPAELVGFDIRTTDVDALRAKALDAGVPELPASLRFEVSGETTIPADDCSFDVVVSWSAFEHILQPISVLREVRRILVDDGVLFIQVWPFYDSEHGSHLSDWFPEGFAQLNYSNAEILDRLRTEPEKSRHGIGMYHAYEILNRITVDELHAALREAGLRIVKLELLSNTIHIPLAGRDLPPSRIGIAGVKLLAVKDHDVSQPA